MTPENPPEGRPAADDAPENPLEGVAGGGEAGSEELEIPLKESGSDEYVPSEMQCEATRLMTAVRDGDMDAFRDLESRTRSRAFMVARSLVGSRDDALEICQEAFMKIFRARESYNPKQPFLPWFHRILRNTCFSHLRKHRRLKKHSLSVTDDQGEETNWEIVDPTPGPTAGIEQEESSQLFREALGELSSNDREIIALRHFQELPYKEIAETLGIPEGTVMSRLFHARRRLRDRLAPLLGDSSNDEGSTRDTVRMK